MISVFFSFIFSFIMSCLVLSSLLSSLLSLSLHGVCLSLSPCDVVCVPAVLCVGVCCWCVLCVGVGVRVWLLVVYVVVVERAVWHAEKPHVSTHKTPPCVRSKRPRVHQHHAHMCFNMCAWCRYTRGRIERTHGGVLSGHTESSPVLLTKNSPRAVLTCPRYFHQKERKNLTHFFEFGRRVSRSTCSRFLQSFPSPDEAVQLKLS